MAGPWEKFKSASPESSGPWSKFKATAPEQQMVEATEEPGLLSKAFDYAGRALDYPGGITRTAAAGLANIPYSIATGKSITQPDDLLNALKGDAPSSSEYMERAGVEEGPSLGPVSTRDVLGLGADIALDPMGAVVGAGKGLGLMGKKIYKSGLKKVDEKLLERGAKPVSDLLMQAGEWGGVKSLSGAADRMANEMAPKRATLYEKAKSAGAKFDSQKATEGAQGLVKDMRADPGLNPLAQRMDEYVGRYSQNTPIDLQVASDWKSNLYDALPDAAFREGRAIAPAKEVQRALAKGHKDEIVRAANEASPGLGQEIDALNEDWGALIGSKKPFEVEVRKANTPNYVTSTDPIVGGLGLLAGGADAGLGLLAAKKLADWSKTTGFRTGLGQGLRKAGGSGAVDPLIQRGIINYGDYLRAGDE